MVGTLPAHASLLADSDFPEDRFECPEKSASAYAEKVERGYQRMRESSVVICGLARDVAPVLPSTAARIERLGRLFGEYRVILYENDSQDGTLEFLQEWQSQNPAVRVLSEKLGRRKWGQVRDLDRAAHLAYCRNQYLQEAVRACCPFDYAVVVDTDIPQGFSYQGIANSFGHDGWDVVGSYGLQYRRFLGHENFPVFFDAWAFREVGHAAPHEQCSVNVRVFQRGQPLLKVWSCFGGVGIYRMTAFASGASYYGNDCEHVTFHAQLRQRGFEEIWLNPSQIVLYPYP